MAVEKNSVEPDLNLVFDGAFGRADKPSADAEEPGFRFCGHLEFPHEAGWDPTGRRFRFLSLGNRRLEKKDWDKTDEQ